MGILLKNGTVVIGASLQTEVDVFIQDERIHTIGKQIDPAGHQVFDCSDTIISPGLIDMHVHLREPGFEYKETIETGTKAAAAGGFTTVACMPNTKPAVDTPELVSWIINEAEQKGSARVLPIAAITKGLKGEELTHIEGIHASGAVGLSDDGRGVQRADRMKAAMQRAVALNMPFLIHAEDETLSGTGCMNESDASKRFGLPGIPAEAEAVMVARDIVLSEVTGAHLHICHVSSKLVADLIRDAKRRGLRVTGEVAPHHLLLHDEQIDPNDSDWKVNPPLRTDRDREACVEAFLDGTLDIVATDHAPHSQEEKQKHFTEAPFGMVGLELAFPLMYTHFVKTGKMSLSELIDRMSTRPAQLFNLPSGKIEVGAIADIAVFDLTLEKQIDPETFQSKGRNTPFKGQTVQGWPVLTIVNGQVTYQA